MKKDVLENIDEGLYELDIFFPTKEFLQNDYYYEIIRKYILSEGYQSTSQLNDGLYFDSKIKCIVKVQKGKNYVEEINTGLKIPLLLLERKLNVYKSDLAVNEQVEDSRCYSIKKSRKIPSYFVVLAETKQNSYESSLKHTSYEFISKRNDNLFSYDDDEYYAITNNYEFGQKELKKLESQEQKTRENLLIIHELKRMPDGIKRYINYGDSNKLQGYKRYFKNGNKK